MEPPSFETRLSAVEARLTAIESRLGGTTAATAFPAAPKIADPALRAMAADFSDDFSRTAAPSPRPMPQEEERPGNWLGIIAAVCFILAAGFIVKLSIESGWLTPARQIGLAAMLGFGLIGTGLALLRSDRAYAGLLPGAGVVVLYLSGFAAHRYYDLISFDAALCVTALVASLCVWLHTRIRHDIYPTVAAVGAYAAPVILGLQAEAAFSLYYFLICSVAFATLSIWMQSRALTVMSAYLALGMTGFVGFDLSRSGIGGFDLDINNLIAVILALQFLVFSLGTYLYSRYARKVLDIAEAFCFLPVLLSFYGLEYHFIDAAHPGLAPWASLGCAGFLVALYLSARKFLAGGGGAQLLIPAFVTLACFHSLYLELMPETARPWLLVAILVGAAFLPLPAAKQRGVLFIPGLALLAIVSIEYMSIVFHLLSSQHGLRWLPAAFASLVSLWLVILAPQGRAGKQENFGEFLLGAAHVLAIAGLYQLAGDAGSLAVSAAWLFYGVGVMAFAYARRDAVMAKSALFVLGFAAGKALLYDAASAPTMIRILCLLLTGAVLYGCGFFMRQTAAWARKP